MWLATISVAENIVIHWQYGLLRETNLRSLLYATPTNGGGHLPEEIHETASLETNQWYCEKISAWQQLDWHKQKDKIFTKSRVPTKSSSPVPMIKMSSTELLQNSNSSLSSSSSSSLSSRLLSAILRTEIFPGTCSKAQCIEYSAEDNAPFLSTNMDEDASSLAELSSPTTSVKKTAWAVVGIVQVWLKSCLFRNLRNSLFLIDHACWIWH